jgi:hypothetical protein
MLSRDVPAVDGWPEVAFPQDSVNFNQQTEDGHFKFEFAPPGTKVTLQRIVGNRPQPYTEFELLPGQEKVIDIELPSKEEGERFKKLKQEDVDLFGAP